MTKNIAKKPNVRFAQVEVPRRVFMKSIDQPRGFQIGMHRHDWGQLLALTHGVVRVKAMGAVWIVPPQRALWIPAGVEHDNEALQAMKMRTAYISPDAARSLPGQCKVVTVSPLLRELLLEVASFPTLYDEEGAEGRCVSVLLDQIKAGEQTSLHLPEPASAPLQKIALALEADPADERNMEEWAEDLGMSPRTLARRFRSETGMTFGQWRQQARLLEAVTRIAAGQPVALIAQDLGYDSQSAFITMFRKALGTTPGKYFD